MNKYMLALSLVASSVVYTMDATSGESTSFYQQKEKEFKDRMFEAQRRLIGDKDKYLTLIAPFIDQLNDLATIQYCKKSSGSKLCEHYMERLFQYNIAYFNSLINSSDLSRPIAVLRQSIQNIKNEGRLDFDVESELNEVVALVKKGNENYYAVVKGEGGQ